MAGSRELLDSLKPGMHLDKNFFLKVYGHEITRPGFAENVIKRLEILGCSKAREYYTCVVTEFEYKHEQEIDFLFLVNRNVIKKLKILRKLIKKNCLLHNSRYRRHRIVNGIVTIKIAYFQVKKDIGVYGNDCL